ncbi:hypothetical protein BDY21DRAFT_386116 [Lineolata rhizophorae]|uniref:HMG box domain-containing protein n=1 Tax=Lineolata rhizophorae TaxID=578093 RepID=A0A6A6NXV7_9PEZI|nr:hypothetical protein BDY21DRAFT_386116 [Lineolata rhizophorae]
MSELEGRLAQLGLSQYLEAFVSEGFDTWDTVLDITESDLYKLQRAIAEARGYSSDQILPVATPAQSIESNIRSDDSGAEGKPAKPAESAAPSNTGPTGKRKYRRHPKPDENAPERPPSSYVIFSNMVREQLRGQELSFTEIAKIVGERWQVLPPEEREACDKQAATAKERYYAELAEYKKTPQYAKYQEYLADFRAKHGHTQAGEFCIAETPAFRNLTFVRLRRKAVKTRDRNKASRRHIGGGADSFAQSRKRAGSSPPPASYSHATTLPSKSASPANYPLPTINSPRVRDQHSPMSVSPISTTMYKEAPHESSPRMQGSVSQPQRLPHSTSPSGFGGPYQGRRDIKSRRAMRETSPPPPLVHEDTTLSSDSATHSQAQPYQGSLLPIMDSSKAHSRLLPHPVPTPGATPSPLDQRQAIGLPVHPAGPSTQAQQQQQQPHDFRHSTSPLSALLRAGELARDAENQPTGESRQTNG